MDQRINIVYTVEIIQARENEIESAALLFDAYRQFYKQPSDIASARNFLSQRLQEKNSVIFLALLHEEGTSSEVQVVGFAQLYPTFASISLKPLWILSDLFVAPEARHKNVGKLLLARSRQLAVETQAEGLTLQTANDNYPAQALYESQGWEKETVYRTYNLYL
jgi:GNAT superfamily N-acetyltransferase